MGGLNFDDLRHQTLNKGSAVFHWRDGVDERTRRIAYVLLVVMCALLFALLWTIVPKEAWAKFDATQVLHKLLRQEKFIEVVLLTLVGILALCAQANYKKNARLILTDDELRHVSGVPVLGQWLDWTLDLTAIRRNNAILKVIGQPMGADPLKFYRLSWGESSIFQIRQIRPSAWLLANQPIAKAIQPKSTLGLVRWRHPENQALLQQQFDQLPLVQALRMRGVTVEAVTGKRQHAGVDLMAYPAFKLAVIGSLVAFVVAFGLFHAMLDQQYFVQPGWTVWVTVAAIAAAIVYMRLRQEQPADEPTGIRAKSLEFVATQVFLACLAGAGAAAVAVSLPLVLSTVSQPAREVTFVLQKSPLRLLAPTSVGIPDVQPVQALDYWASLPDGEIVMLPVRRGIGGLWWQFDSSALSDSLDKFYGSRSRR